MRKRIIKLKNARISCAASVVGRNEGAGPLGRCFDKCDDTDSFGADTWEKAESAMQRSAFELMQRKIGGGDMSFDAVFAGDLQNQCVGSSYGLLDFDVPYLGLYGACSTAVEGLILSAMGVDGGFLNRAAVVTSSHYLAAQRQYRTPIEYGAQRSPTAQWTVTGAGAFCVEGAGSVMISEAVVGVTVDKGINDASNMGAAMAPSAADTLLAYFSEGSCGPCDFDAIVTGDLGAEGGSILCEMLAAEGVDISDKYNDCGILIYDREKQDKHSGGSGCGCSAVVLASYFLEKITQGEIKNMLLLGTGAMMSPSSIQQGLSIPAITHMIRLEHTEE